MKRGMPITKSGPAQSAMPTTINTKPRIKAANRPSAVTTQASRRNGSATSHQIAPKTAPNMPPSLAESVVARVPAIMFSDLVEPGDLGSNTPRWIPSPLGVFAKKREPLGMSA